MRDKKKLDQDLFPLFAFLASAARSGIDEGVYTATLRLVDTISRLLEVFPELKEEPFFKDIDGFVREKMSKAYLASPEEYIAFLDELLRQFAVEVSKRNGIETET